MADVTLSTDERGFVLETIQVAIRQIRAIKPDDRSAKDRRYAVLLTDLERAYAWAHTYIQDDGEAG